MLKRYLLIASIAALWPMAAFAQTTIGPLPQSSNLTSAAPSVSGQPQQYPSFLFQLAGTWTGTVTFEGRTDESLSYVSILTASVTDGSLTTTATANGAWSAANPGYSSVRARFSTATSGTVNAVITPGYAQARVASPQFTNVKLDSLCFSAASPDACFDRAGANIIEVSSGDRLALQDGTAAAPSLTFALHTGDGLSSPNGGALDFSISGVGVARLATDWKLTSTGAYSWASGAYNAAADLYLFRDAANTLACRNGTNACTTRIYNSFTDASNGEWFETVWGANEAYVVTKKNGSGAFRSLHVGTDGGTGVLYLRTAGTDVWQVSAAGHLLSVTDNTYDIGASGATRPRNLFMGSTITTGAGTTALAPIILTNGTNLTSATANAVENDGIRKYWTQNTTNGRSVDDTWNYFQLTGDGTGITSIADFFGATGSGIPLVSGARYEIEWHCVFTQATAGTATWTIVTATTALANLEANYIGSNIAGLGTVGAPQMAGTGAVTGSSSTALPVTGTEATGVSHSFDIHAMITAGAGASNTRLRLTMSAGTATPKAGSYIKVRQLPAANTGTFVS